MTRYLLSLTLTCAAFGADLPQKQVRGRQIVDQALAALGGERFLAMQDRVETGRLYSFYREQLNGLATARIYTKYRKPANPDDIGVYERQSFGKKEEDFAYLFTPEEALQVTFRGLRPFPAGQYDRWKDSTARNIFYILKYRLNEPGMLIEFRETAVVENNPVEIVDFTDASNRVVSVYFHRTTHLPMRQEFKRRDAETKQVTDELTVYNKFRDTGGVFWPWSVVRYRNGDRIFEMYSESVEINSNPDPKFFQPTPGAKRLKPE